MWTSHSLMTNPGNYLCILSLSKKITEFDAKYWLSISLLLQIVTNCHGNCFYRMFIGCSGPRLFVIIWDYWDSFPLIGSKTHFYSRMDANFTANNYLKKFLFHLLLCYSLKTGAHFHTSNIPMLRKGASDAHLYHLYQSLYLLMMCVDTLPFFHCIL